MNKFNEYPKVMKHPQHSPAVWKQLEGKGKGLFVPDTVCTQPERLPNITVTDIEQEKLYASRGYRPANNPDPAAYEQAILDAQPYSGDAFQEFPKWKYHPFQIPVVVKSASEERALGPEWKDAPIVATEDDVAPPATAGGPGAAGGSETQQTNIAKPDVATKAKKKAKKAAAPKKAKAQQKAAAPA